MTETTRPTFTVSGAAEATGKSRRTIGRLLDAGKLEGAHQDHEGVWHIPAESLLAAGLRLYEPSPPDNPDPTREVTPPDPVAALERELAEWRRRAEVAEAVAQERAAALEDVRAALTLAQRMLTPGAETPVGAAETPAGSPVNAHHRESSWWTRWWHR